MLKKFKNYIIISLTIASFGVPLLAPVAAFAAPCTSAITTGIESGVAGATSTPASCDAGNTPGQGVSGGIVALAKEVVNILSVIVGVIAVVMIIFGGFRYITSGGDSGKVGNAKNTLIYAIVGLIIVALAQLIVHYVLNTTNTVTSTAAAGTIYSVTTVL